MRNDAIFKGLLLAAGHGIRMSRILDRRPKALLDVEGKSLIRRQVETLSALGIEDVVVVVRPEHRHTVVREIEWASRFRSSRLICCCSESGFDSFCAAQEELRNERFVLLVIDSLYRRTELLRFRSFSRLRPRSFVVGTTPFLHDEKPAYAVIRRKRVIDVGRKCRATATITAGVYHCPSDFYEQVTTAREQGVCSLVEYFGLWVRTMRHGIPYRFSTVVDVDTPRDLVIAQKFIRKGVIV